MQNCLKRKDDTTDLIFINATTANTILSRMRSRQTVLAANATTERCSFSECDHGTLFFQWMRPRNVVLSVNATMERCSFSECDHGTLFFQWMRPRNVYLSVNATTERCSFSECDHGTLFFQWMRLRGVVLSVNATTGSCSFSEGDHGTLFFQWMWLWQFNLEKATTKNYFLQWKRPWTVVLSVNVNTEICSFSECKHDKFFF
jgi:uncharacterized protein YjbI with pentapeptide repeats